jgi:hypothetical protein
MNAQDRAAIEQMLEMLVDNREYIEANERDTYLAMYDKAIADGEILLRKPIYVQEPDSECNPYDLCAGCRCKFSTEYEPPAQPSKPDYAWPTVQDYEREVGYEVNDTFKGAWAMARTTNDMFGGSEE